jgi:hypothetical protein
MRCLLRMLSGLGARPAGGQDAVILRHRLTGEYLAPGALLAAKPADALVFPSAATAVALTSQFACEPGSFVAIPTPDRLTSAA